MLSVSELPRQGESCIDTPAAQKRMGSSKAHCQMCVVMEGVGQTNSCSGLHLTRRADALPGVAHAALGVQAQQPLELTATPSLVEALATLREVLADASLAARAPTLVQLGMRGAESDFSTSGAGRADAPAHYVVNETGAALQCWLGPRLPAGAPPGPGADGTMPPYQLSYKWVLIYVIRACQDVGGSAAHRALLAKRLVLCMSTAYSFTCLNVATGLGHWLGPVSRCHKW